jgi:hypothetical protein
VPPQCHSKQCANKHLRRPTRIRLSSIREARGESCGNVSR